MALTLGQYFITLPYEAKANSQSSGENGALRIISDGTATNYLQVYDPNKGLWRGVILENFFEGGDASFDSITAMTDSMLLGEDSDGIQENAGSLTLNSQALGTYEYLINTNASTTISSNPGTAWYSNSNENYRSSFVVYTGNLTINSGVTIEPGVRKLFTVLKVGGNLVHNGNLRMLNKGANHGSQTEATIKIDTGTLSGVTGPQVPSSGGGGGGRRAAGGSGSAGGTGGGGGGTGQGTPGVGSAGTSHTGGTGGGGADASGAGNGAPRGGAGGRGGNQRSGGGAGNPGGARGSIGGEAGQTGTGGVLIVVCDGNLSGSGTFDAQCTARGGAGSGREGGSSGGGSATIVYGTNSGDSTSVIANGAPTRGSGGAGGAGTARKLQR